MDHTSTVQCLLIFFCYFARNVEPKSFDSHVQSLGHTQLLSNFFESFASLTKMSLFKFFEFCLKRWENVVWQSGNNCKIVRRLSRNWSVTFWNFCHFGWNVEKNFFDNLFDDCEVLRFSRCFDIISLTLADISFSWVPCDISAFLWYFCLPLTSLRYFWFPLVFLPPSDIPQIFLISSGISATLWHPSDISGFLWYFSLHLASLRSYQIYLVSSGISATLWHPSDMSGFFWYFCLQMASLRYFWFPLVFQWPSGISQICLVSSGISASLWHASDMSGFLWYLSLHLASLRSYQICLVSSGISATLWHDIPQICLVSSGISASLWHPSHMFPLVFLPPSGIPHISYMSGFLWYFCHRPHSLTSLRYVWFPMVFLPPSDIPHTCLVSSGISASLWHPSEMSGFLWYFSLSLVSIRCLVFPDISASSLCHCQSSISID